MILSRLALASVLLLAPSLIAQSSDSPAPVPTIKADTRLTIVDITVTDKNGQPVHGLTQSDFTIKEDGKPQPIRNFNEFGTTPPPAQAASNLPPGVYTNQATPRPTGTVNIILFSQLGSAPDLLYSQAQALKYLKTLPPGTRVAILVLENGVHVIQNITTGRDILVAAVNGVQYHPVAGATFAGVSSLGVACEVANKQSRLTIDALRQISASFASIRGRKNLVWFTHGIPWLTNVQYYKQHIGCLDNDTQQLHEAYAMLTASQVAISTIDPRGLEGTDGYTAGAIAKGFLDRQLNHESIRDFAEATGGTAYYNRNDLDTALHESIATNADYYAVSYTPPLVGYDGKYHTFNVKVNRPGLHLEYRQGYTSLDVAKLNHTIEQGNSNNATAGQSTVPPALSQFFAAMGHGVEPSSQLLMAARIAAVKPATPPVEGNLSPKVKPNSLVRYDVIYAIPAGELSLTEGPDGTRKAAIRFDVVAYGEDGARLNIVSKTATVNLQPDHTADFQKKPFEVMLQIDLPPGNLFVRMGAFDVSSGKIGTIEVPQKVAKL